MNESLQRSWECIIHETPDITTKWRNYNLECFWNNHNKLSFHLQWKSCTKWFFHVLARRKIQIVRFFMLFCSDNSCRTFFSCFLNLFHTLQVSCNCWVIKYLCFTTSGFVLQVKFSFLWLHNICCFQPNP